ncbi:MAG: 5'/3'-nucleotidase SurE [Clostridia bacterium]|nr:5'/3'-nucleotidase SurE [Clostridia bacterium]
MKKILVSNDDGIRAEGISKLVSRLSEKAEVYICAPDGQRSAAGQSITAFKGLTAREVSYPGAKLAFETSGTPADCVKLGIYLCRKKGIEIDCVFSGINHGGNLGTDVFYSGTVAAAREGCFCGKPSVAVSMCSIEPKNFDFAAGLALAVFESMQGKLPPQTILNINVPDIPNEEIRGVKYLKTGHRRYEEGFLETEDENGEIRYSYRSEIVRLEENEKNAGTDILGVQDGYAVITPLAYDTTDYGMLEEVRRWRAEDILRGCGGPSEL